MASTSVSGALVSLSTRHAGGVVESQLLKSPRIGRSEPHRASPLSDPGDPHRGRAGAENRPRSAVNAGEVVRVRVRTYGFPGFLRGLPDSSTPTTPTNQPRRSLSSPGVSARSSTDAADGFDFGQPDSLELRASDLDHSSSRLNCLSGFSLQRRKAQCSIKANPSRGGDAKPGVSCRQPSRRLLSITARRRRRPDMEVTMPFVIHPRVRKGSDASPRSPPPGGSPARASRSGVVPTLSTTTPLSQFGDTNNYFVVPGGTFEGSSLPVGWMPPAPRSPPVTSRFTSSASDNQSLTIRPAAPSPPRTCASTPRCRRCGSSPIRSARAATSRSTCS